MKGIFRRRPSIAELTGICESRLGYLATHLRAYLMGSSLGSSRASYAGSVTPSSNTVTDIPDSTQSAQCSSMPSKHHRPRCSSSQSVKAQGSLSPRSSSFKDGLARSLTSLRSSSREKSRRRGDSFFSVENLTVASSAATSEPNSIGCEIESHSRISSCKLPSSFLDSLTSNPATGVSSPNSSPYFSPHYCWCPLSTSTPLDSSQSPSSSSQSPLLPPLSSLLSANTRSSSPLNPKPPLSLADIPSLDFPAYLPDPLVRLQISSSQQIPTFTPLMCDPIVHIPVIDVCSSGQGYLVSAGPAISTTIPPLLPKLVNHPLIPENDSVADKGARETLRLLISSSSQTNPPLIDVLPAVLTTADEKQTILVAGSRGLYGGTRDIDAVGNSISMVSFTGSLPTIGDTEKLDGESVDLNVQGGDFPNDIKFREERIGWDSLIIFGSLSVCYSVVCRSVLCSKRCRYMDVALDLSIVINVMQVLPFCLKKLSSLSVFVAVFLWTSQCELILDC